MVIWLTGLPGAGKTTLAVGLADRLTQAVILDGDQVRTWLTPDCDFSREGRRRHVLRVGRVASLIERVGGVPIVALVSPIDADRREAIACCQQVRVIHVTGPARQPYDGTIPYEIPSDAWPLDTQ